MKLEISSSGLFQINLFFTDIDFAYDIFLKIGLVKILPKAEVFLNSEYIL
jgi:hypothetical protein